MKLKIGDVLQDLRHGRVIRIVTKINKYHVETVDLHFSSSDSRLLSIDVAGSIWSLEKNNELTLLVPVRTNDEATEQLSGAKYSGPEDSYERKGA